MSGALRLAATLVLLGTTALGSLQAGSLAPDAQVVPGAQSTPAAQAGQPAPAAQRSPAAPAATSAPEAPSESGSGSAEDEGPDPTLDGLLTVTPAVEQWFASEAQIVARSSADTVLGEVVAGRADHVTVGAPRPVLGWSDDLIDGSLDGPLVAPTSQAVAPVLLDGAAVGVVVLDTRNDTFEGELRAAPGLAPDLRALDPDVAVVHDDRTGAWYGYAHRQVRPLDATARSMLAGSIDIVDYRPFLVDPDSGVEPTEESGNAVRWVVVAGAIVVGAVLLAAGFSFWLRTPDDETEERPRPPGGRLRARVRAELRNGRPGSWNHRG